MINILHVLSVVNIFLALGLLFVFPLGLHLSSAIPISSEIRWVFTLSMFCAYMSLVYPACKLFFRMDSDFLKRKKVIFYASLFLLVSSYVQTIELTSTKTQNINSEIAFKDLEKKLLEGGSEELVHRNFTSKEYGQNAPFLKSFSDLVDFTNQQDKILEAAYQESKFETMLTPSNLDRRNLKHSLKNLVALKQQVDENLKRRLEYRQQYLAEISSILKTSFSQSKNSVEIYMNKEKASTNLLKELFRIKQKIIHQLESLLSFLLEIRDSFVFENDMLVFDYDEQLQEYRERFTDLEKLATEENSIFLKICEP